MVKKKNRAHKRRIRHKFLDKVPKKTNTKEGKREYMREWMRKKNGIPPLRFGKVGRPPKIPMPSLKDANFKLEDVRKGMKQLLKKVVT